MNSVRGTVIFLVAALPLLWADAAAAQTVRVPRSISFAEDAQVRQAVKDQCELQTRIPQFVDEFSDQVELVDGSPGSSGRVLEIQIDGARAAGGGVYSGSKWVAVSGVLREDGKQVADFSGRRSTVGYFNFSACGAAARCAKALGKDIAEWLREPKPNAVFGTD